MEDGRLDAASTVPAVDLRSIHAAFQHGGTEHIAALLDFIESRARRPLAWREPPSLTAIPAAGRFEAGCRKRDHAKGQALIVFYRSLMLARDTAPIGALADSLAGRGLEVTAIFVASLKDADSIAFVRAELSRDKPDVIVNTTGFSARLEGEASVLDGADAPVLQAIFASATEAQWRENPRGIGAAVSRALSAAGWKLVLVDSCSDDPAVDYSLATLGEFEAVVRECGPDASGHVADVRDQEGLDVAVEVAVSRFGGLDAAVAVAGMIGGGPAGWETGDELWEAMIDVNLAGVWRLARAAVPAMLAMPMPRQGRFVAVASAGGVVGSASITSSRDCSSRPRWPRRSCGCVGQDRAA